MQNRVLAALLLPVAGANYCSWRQTAGCDPDGVREPHGDRGCAAVIARAGRGLRRRPWELVSGGLLDRCAQALVNTTRPGLTRCSSGMLATAWAIERCASVDVYGAVVPPLGSPRRGCFSNHYYDAKPGGGQKKEECFREDVAGGTHEFSEEHALSRLWERAGWVRLRTGLELNRSES